MGNELHDMNMFDNSMTKVEAGHLEFVDDKPLAMDTKEDAFGVEYILTYGEKYFAGISPIGRVKFVDNFAESVRLSKSDAKDMAEKISGVTVKEVSYVIRPVTL